MTSRIACKSRVKSACGWHAMNSYSTPWNHKSAMSSMLSSRSSASASCVGPLPLGRGITNMARQLAVTADESRRCWRLTAHRRAMMPIVRRRGTCLSHHGGAQSRRVGMIKSVWIGTVILVALVLLRPSHAAALSCAAGDVTCLRAAIHAANTNGAAQTLMSPELEIYDRRRCCETPGGDRRAARRRRAPGPQAHHLALPHGEA